MTTLLDKIQPTLLMGPGPSCVPDAVYKAISCSTLGHLDPAFIQIMDAIKEQLSVVLNTKNHVTMPMSGTGSAGMETCFVNLIEKDDPVLILINGVFGVRMQEVASRLGAQVDVLEFAWGTPVVVEKVADQLKKKKYSLIAVVHAETSTGVCNPVAELAPLVKENDALYLVDCVTSLGGIPVYMDDWKIDALYSGTQKCLSCPPGLAPISFSDQALAKLASRKTKVPNWYLDMSLIVNYWEGNTRAYHHTAPINMNYALYAALDVLLQEGLENVYARHAKMHSYLVQELENMGLTMAVKKEHRLPMLNAVLCPENCNEADVRKQLLAENIEIGAGLGPLAGKIWRIGLMGHTARKENIDRVIRALTKALQA